MRTLFVLVVFGVFSFLLGNPSGDLRAEGPFAVDDEGRIVNFSRDIAPIFATQCMRCHNANDRKGDLRMDVREEVMNYIEPGDAESSSLLSDFLLSTDEDMLMPPRSQGGPLFPNELTRIQVWINEGAIWPDGVEVIPTGKTELKPPPAAPQRSIFGRVWAAQGFLHPAVVHFPIALLTLGAIFVVLGWKWPAIGTQVPLACLLIGSVSAVAASMMGWAFAVERGYGSWSRFDAEVIFSPVFQHRWGAVAVSVASLFFSFIALLSIKKESEKLTRIWKIGLLLCAGLVGAVGHKGGEMSYGEDFYPRMIEILTGSPETANVAPEPSAKESDLSAAHIEPIMPSSSLIVPSSGIDESDRVG